MEKIYKGEIIVKFGKIFTCTQLLNLADQLDDIQSYLSKKVAPEIFKKWGVPVKFKLVKGG